MRALRWLLKAEALLLLGSLQFGSFFATASPSVNVALKASFPSAPYLVELLEAAADEDPSVYFPILDRIADGYFDDAKTDEQLYKTFLQLLREDGLLSKPEALSSFQFGLSIHNSAPRIEAHYQYYGTAIEPLLKSTGEAECDTWLLFQGKQYCDPKMEKPNAEIPGPEVEDLPFDRRLGETEAAIPSVVYADITSPSFKMFHKTISDGAKNGKNSYKVRYKPPVVEAREPLGVYGYGVSLDLKRTDYIVIDDRQAEEAKSKNQDDSSKIPSAEQDIADLKPLSESELAPLDLKASSYVLQTEDPLDTLLSVTQDFPKHSSFLASRNVSTGFLQEHKGNRELFLPPGFSVMWVNGVQMDARTMDAFSVLDHLRRERKLIGYFMDIGLTAPEAIKLLSHPAIAEAQGDVDPQRYDWRDQTEGGRVIVWLNDLEKDKRYQDWPFSIFALLQRSFPGQLPAVRKDIQNAIVPVDFSDPKAVMMVTDTLSDLIARKVPCRWGIVPITKTKEAAEQARVVYHLQETYGLAAVMQYLHMSLSKKKIGSPHLATFDKVKENRKVKTEKRSLQLQEVLKDEDITSRIDAANAYLDRLGANGPTPPMFVNGIPIKQDDEWLPALSQRVSQDLLVIQRGVFQEQLSEKDWLPGIFLVNSSPRRNPLIMPEDEKDIRLFNLANVYREHEDVLREMPTVPVDEDSEKLLWTQLIVVADMDTTEGLRLAATAIQWRITHPNVQLLLVYNRKSEGGSGRGSRKAEMIIPLMPPGVQYSEYSLSNLHATLEGFVESLDEPTDITESLWPDTRKLVQSFGFQPGESGLVINGRKLGPIPHDVPFTFDDYTTLYRFEVKKRIQPAAAAIRDFDLSDKLTNPHDAAKLHSLLAVSTVSDIPEGIFELPPPVRTGYFEQWNATHTAITTGDNNTAILQVVVSLDPATELAQRWVPILKALSELDGLYMRIFLNPRDKLQELPVKRFYRYVLQSKPSFDEDGCLKTLSAKFEGLPKETLLTMAMDVPPSWLVAPKESIYDLDNIKLSSVPAGAVVDAVYELENILIEGHSRDVTAVMPPRGVQLVLSTAKDPHLTDTIVMANLGFFQFKANPGYYNLKLQDGPSEEIFKIDSVGAMGYSPQPGDETTDVALLSFQGVTLFPRLSRKPGKEGEDVLEDRKTGAATDIVSKGSEFIGDLLKHAGLKKAETSKHISLNITNIFRSQIGQIPNIVQKSRGTQISTSSQSLVVISTSAC